MKHRGFQKKRDEANTQMKVMEPKQERRKKEKTGEGSKESSKSGFREDLSGTWKQSGTSLHGPTCQCRLDLRDAS